MSSAADIAIYGGAAGGGKTFARLLEPLRHVSNKNFGAVIFRRTTPQITNDGALWDESLNLYPPEERAWTGSRHSSRSPIKSALRYDALAYRGMHLEPIEANRSFPL